MDGPAQEAQERLMFGSQYSPESTSYSSQPMFRDSNLPILLAAQVLVSNIMGIVLIGWLWLEHPLPTMPDNRFATAMEFAWIGVAIATISGGAIAYWLHCHLNNLNRHLQTLGDRLAELSERSIDSDGSISNRTMEASPMEESPVGRSPSSEPLITESPIGELNLSLILEQSLSTAPDFSNALRITLEQITQLTGWSYAEAWIPTGDKSALQCSPIWHCDRQQFSSEHLDALQDFRHYTEGLILLPGEEIPGRVWQSNQPEWLGNLTQDSDIFSRGAFARDVGLEAAFGLPLPANEPLAANLIPSHSQTLGILVFFIRQSSKPDRALISLLSKYAPDFGRILHQKQIATEFKTLFAAMTDPILVFDDQGYILNIAPTTPKPLYQMSPDLIGKNLQDIFEPEQATTFIEWIWETLNTQQTLQREYKLIINDQVVWFSTTIAPISNVSGTVDSVIWIARDITERQQAMEALSKAKETAEEANQAKSTFLAKMSHELRTPLNSILGFTQVMLRHMDGSPLRLTSEQMEEHLGYLQVIHNSGDHLLELINDLLDWSKIEAGKMLVNPTQFNIYEILDTLYQMFRLKAENQGLRLVFDIDRAVPPFLEADSGKLRQILINLLGNAMKFTPQGQVTVRVYWSEGETGDREQLICEVADTGIGIAPTELEQLFEPFVQSSGDRGYQEGTGLGLPISQQMVELMGGELMVESEVGEGTTFQFVLPVKIKKISLNLNEPNVSIPKIPEHLQGLGVSFDRNSLAEEKEDLSYVAPADWKKLQQATLEADEERLLHMIEEIFPPQSSIFKCLSQWVHDFRFNRVYELISDQIAHLENKL
ncbi:ATP-binding protein [Roseofilum casamattae]|nr:ATP-binding protein [Roseofilum casamattae]